jgi:hypothetical protein
VSNHIQDLYFIKYEYHYSSWGILDRILHQIIRKLMILQIPAAAKEDGLDAAIAFAHKGQRIAEGTMATGPRPIEF